MEDDFGPVAVCTTAIESQLADKICAMREMHPSGYSTRYHDLADVIIILLTQTVSAQGLYVACKHEARRRGLEAFENIWVPPAWNAEFPQKAESYYGLPEQYWGFPEAFNYTSSVLDRLLSGEMQNKVWNPSNQRWEHS